MTQVSGSESVAVKGVRQKKPARPLALIGNILIYYLLNTYSSRVVTLAPSRAEPEGLRSDAWLAADGLNVADLSSAGVAEVAPHHHGLPRAAQPSPTGSDVRAQRTRGAHPPCAPGTAERHRVSGRTIPVRLWTLQRRQQSWFPTRAHHRTTYRSSEAGSPAAPATTPAFRAAVVLTPRRALFSIYKRLGNGFINAFR